MEPLRHEVAWAAMHTILEGLPPSTFLHETRASVAFSLYHWITSTLEAYDAQIGFQQQQHREPSRN
jgi:hypothetical protein